MTRLLLAAIWLLLAAVPFCWWLWQRRRVDVWRALPVSAALLARDGSVRATAGPDAPTALALTGPLPAAGRSVRTASTNGTPLAVSGLRGGGALVLALATDPVRDRRDRVLAELGARLAHDINTPVAALQGHLDLLAHDAISDQSRDSVRTCQRELARLQTTAQDLLTFTRLRAGGGHRSVQLAGALAEEAAAALLDAADARGVELTVETPNEPVFVDVADADLIRALRNLVDNALVHGAAAGGTVCVIVDADNDAVTFTVSDTGPGLSGDRLLELCEPLVRGESASSGTGLGLAIVSEVLSAHASTLESVRTPNGLAALSFTLPRFHR